MLAQTLTMPIIGDSFEKQNRSKNDVKTGFLSAQSADLSS
ncbi:hypothetical protein FHS72_002516 [Loktanella ponticola]|uniref:Uncharacterized protein n=1 Tax=Yoonia ponticola TaxID=1524255 RepID=A0A7W9BLW0_9RHOB|nr:hypothetical protein [Yoonia ponticola]